MRYTNPPEALQPYFTKEGVLRQIPRKERTRTLLLEYVATVFAPGISYTEAEVNALLAGHEVDHATLRRYMIDMGIMERSGGIYRIAGGEG